MCKGIKFLETLVVVSQRITDKIDMTLIILKKLVDLSISIIRKEQCFGEFALAIVLFYYTLFE